MRLSKSRSSSLDFPDASSADFSSQPCIVYTDRQTPIPLLMTAPRSICALNLAGIAKRPFASIECSYSPRNISDPLIDTFFDRRETSCNGGPLRSIPEYSPVFRNAPLSSLTNLQNHHFSPLFPTRIITDNRRNM